MADTGSGAARLPLSALLSQVLVAFVIEFDNEFERQMPHRTTDHGRAHGQGKVPWLVSMAMWSTCMRFVTAGGITVGELARRARTGTNLAGMQRWGYIRIAPDPADTRPKPPRSGWVIRATASGRQAQQVWLPLTGVIEERWAARFGADNIAALKKALQSVDARLDPELPDCLPILGYGLWSTRDGERPENHERPDSHEPPQSHARAEDHVQTRDHARAEDHARPATEPGRRAEPPQPRTDLPVLLSRVLLAFAFEYEQESPVSLAISANVLRVLDETGMRVRDLPGLSGVSSEGISMAMGILAKRGLAVSGPATDGGRGQAATLTPKGRNVQNKCRERLTEIEHRWQARFGRETVTALRDALERLTSDPGSRLSEGLEAPPGGWRAAVRAKPTLPQYPMVLHRGGFPDGS